MENMVSDDWPRLGQDPHGRARYHQICLYESEYAVGRSGPDVGRAASPLLLWRIGANTEHTRGLLYERERWF